MFLVSPHQQTNPNEPKQHEQNQITLSESNWIIRSVSMTEEMCQANDPVIRSVCVRSCVCMSIFHLQMSFFDTHGCVYTYPVQWGWLGSSGTFPPSWLYSSTPRSRSAAGHWSSRRRRHPGTPQQRTDGWVHRLCSHWCTLYPQRR